MKRRTSFTHFHILWLLISSLIASPPAFSQSLGQAQLSAISQVVEEAIHKGQTPGAVVLVGNQGRVVFHQAYGTLAPQRPPMSLDTIFDIASLTKVVATAPAILQLMEQGKLSLEDPVFKHWPEFKTKNKKQITVRHLLTHYSGLRPGLPLKGNWSGYEAALRKIIEEKPDSPPGIHFSYSDINFLTLAELVRRISGQPIDAYCHDHIFGPLRMKDTGFKPSPALHVRLAPTKEMQKGEVHDPVARRMGGVAGHAGVFSTADDLSAFAQALLAGGRSESAKILSPSTVEMMFLPQSPPGKFPLRGLGWAIFSPSGGEWSQLLPEGSYGHKGFTGTMLWIDPFSKTYLIVLTNRVYSSENTNHETLRDQIFSLVAGAAGRAHLWMEPYLADQTSGESPPGTVKRVPEKVQTGIDVLAAKKFAPLAGLRVGLITNHSGLDSAGRRTIDLLFKAKGVKLKAIFTPEHGLSGKADAKVPSARDPITKLPVYSLYGDTLCPTPKMLKRLDALVFDVQDAGTRFYTYVSTMGYALEAASKRKIAFYVLDRPNPITACMVQGPVMDRELKSFTGYFPLPIRHGMTVGELAKMFNGENKMGTNLRVIEMSGYRRSVWYDETGLSWVNPSPNLRSLTQAILYPGVALIEGSNVSVGRGTDTPFEFVGAPWVRAKELSDYLNNRKIPGVEFQPAGFTPVGNRFKGEACYGVQILLADRQALDSAVLGIEIISALYRLYPKDFQIDKTLSLVGSRSVLNAFKEGQDPQSIVQSWQESLEQFRQLRSKYLIYQD